MPIYRTDRHELDGEVIEVEQVDVTVEVVELSLHDLIRQARTAMRGVLAAPDLPSGTLTAAQLSNAARARQAENKALAQAIVRLARLAVRDLDATD